MIVFLKTWALLLFFIFPIFFLLKYFELFVHFKIYLNLLKWGEDCRSHKNSSYSFLASLYKFCLCACLSCIIIAIAEPCLYRKTKTYNGKGASIMFLLDISPSMAVKDIGGKRRFDVAKKIIDHVITYNKSSSFSLCTFAHHASCIIHSTIDIATFLLRLNLVEIGDAGEGTCIAESLALALANIRSQQAYIVLLTDGENNTGSLDPLLISKIMQRRKGIKLFVIQLGKEGYAPLEYFDKQKQKQYTGSYLTRTDSSELEYIATNAGGKYLTMQEWKENLHENKEMQVLLKDLETLSLLENSFVQMQKEEFAFYFLAVALMLSGASWLIARVIMGLTND